MWLTSSVIEQVDELAFIRYINVQDAMSWNIQRRPEEIRLLTGWEWIARRGHLHRQGFKTQTVAYRDAYYTLVRHEDAPSLLITRSTLRIVK
jgi:hypothetical protein